MAHSPSLFDLDERYAALSTTGDPLERLSGVVDFKMFRSDLDTPLWRSNSSKGGRPPVDPVLGFKVLVLQSLYDLADEQTEFQIRDPLSFMRFLDPDLDVQVPDARTIWRSSTWPGLKWSQESGQSAKVYPKPLKGYENGEAPELYRPV